MKKFLFTFLIFLSQVALASPLGTLVTVEDGLQFDDPKNISDDYIRLSVNAPSYTTTSVIQNSINDFLGPGLVEVRSDSLVLVQAPRDSSQRVSFIAALMNLEVEISE